MPGTSELSTIDYGNAALILQSSDRSLGEVLAALAAPTAPDAKAATSAMPVSGKMTPELQRALNALPEVFRAVKPPASRRALAQTDLARLLDAKEVRDVLLKELKKWGEEEKEMISTHFDVVAEKEKRAAKKTPRDDKGHYQLATPGNPETVELQDRAQVWSRERAGDTTILSQRLLDDAYAANKISRAEYLAVTTPVTGRVLDEEKVRKLLLSKAGRSRAQKVIKLIGEVKRGVISIHTRPAKNLIGEVKRGAASNRPAK